MVALSSGHCLYHLHSSFHHCRQFIWWRWRDVEPCGGVSSARLFGKFLLFTDRHRNTFSPFRCALCLVYFNLRFPFPNCAKLDALPAAGNPKLHYVVCVCGDFWQWWIRRETWKPHRTRCFQC